MNTGTVPVQHERCQRIAAQEITWPAVQLMNSPEALATMKLNSDYFDSLINRMVLGMTTFCFIACIYKIIGSDGKQLLVGVLIKGVIFMKALRWLWQ